MKYKSASALFYTSYEVYSYHHNNDHLSMQSNDICRQLASPRSDMCHIHSDRFHCVHHHMNNISNVSQFQHHKCYCTGYTCPIHAIGVRTPVNNRLGGHLAIVYTPNNVNRNSHNIPLNCTTTQAIRLKREFSQNMPSQMTAIKCNFSSCKVYEDISLALSC